MNIHSILETLKGDATSNAEGKLVLTEDSFLLGIIKRGQKSHGDSNGFTVKMNWQDWKRQVLPLTCLLLTATCFFLKCIIYAVYWQIERVCCLFSSRKPRKTLGTSPRVNLVLTLVVITFYFAMLVSMLSFFIKDVILFRPDTYVNDSGAICFPQSSKQEHYMFLLNAAQCWTNTGIKVLEGDKVTVTASGSFFSKIAEMDSFARLNIKPIYYRVNVLQKSQERDSTMLLWMYHKNDARFGSLLVQIKDDYELPSFNSDEEKIIQLDTIKCHQPSTFRVKKAGVLNFNVNDIYLNNGCEPKITKYKDVLHLDFKPYENVLRNFKQRPQMWYDDNVGDILLSIRIDRKKLNGSPLISSCMARIYFWIDGFFFSPNSSQRILELGLYLLLWFAIDFIIVRYTLLWVPRYRERKTSKG